MSAKEPPFQPVISAESKVPEFSFRAITLGILLGLLFGVGNAYLALKIGTTVSASIPAAVISMAILRLLFSRVSILENNLVQTIASVGEGLAAGVVFTVPALFLIGEPPSIEHIFLLALLGGVLGVLFMIPMRRYLIIQEHGKLPFPEGTACAEILKSGERSLKQAKFAGIGLLVGGLHKLCTGALFLWNEVTTWVVKPFQRTEISFDCTPALLGVGFIIGPRISSYLFVGGALGWWVLIPLFRFFGGEAVIYPATTSIVSMSADDIWSNYVRYIGAGAITIGGLMSLIKIAPLIGKTLKIGFGELFQRASSNQAKLRTERDISLKWLILGSIIILLILWLIPGLNLNFLTILILIILGFFFVAVTSLTVGLIGSTSNPVSGMTITTLLITCLIFVGLGWIEKKFLVAALTMGVVANVAICLGATTSQDLKTGFLVGATPRTQQIGEIIGAILPALAIGGTLYLLNKAYGFGTSRMPAPQATMMETIVKGVMGHDIPYTLVIVGIILGVLVELFKIPILPFAVGLYLPLSLSTATMIGGIAAYCFKKTPSTSLKKEEGILAASGLVAGDAFMGVIVALLSVMGWIPTSGTGFLPDFIALIIYVLMGVWLWLICHRKQLLK